MKIYKNLIWSLGIIISPCMMMAQRASQVTDPVIQNIVKEATQNSQLEELAYHLVDVIGPRLIGTPGMEKANDWTVNKFKEWGIDAQKEQFGSWDSWERGITEVAMISPRVKSLEAQQLAWSPATKNKIEAEVTVLPNLQSSSEFSNWLKSIKGKFVLVDQNQRWGRSDEQMKEFATPELYEKIKQQRATDLENYNEIFKKIGETKKSLVQALEKAGAAGIGGSYWTGITGVSRVFGMGAFRMEGAYTKEIPMINFSLEDYGTLYRLASHNAKPKISIKTESKNLGKAKSFNTIAMIKGKEKPEEYVVLSAHLDSWDGAGGATDNATGVITMMETARILKKYYPNNKRTIIIGLWGSEEQGLNGSRSFVIDHPKIIKNTQAAFNQDNGTGRIVNIRGEGFVDSYDFLSRWISAIPREQRRHIQPEFPAMPSSGGSDNASFTMAGVPGISLGALDWGYFGYTWHTNRDTYDKIIFEEVKNNVIVTAILAYQASEEPDLVNREKRVLPKGEKWPEIGEPQRSGNNFKND